MQQVTVVELGVTDGQAARLRFAVFLNKVVFGSLLVLLVTTAIPYGTAEPWWKAAFVSGAFCICIVAIVESLLSGESHIGGARGILLSMLALSGFAFLQTVNYRSGNPDPAVSALGPWNAISSDPYQTRFFVLQVLSLTICLALLYRYCGSKKRINILIHTVIGVAVVSALFGILRQTVQHAPGFVLPRTMPGQGYGQFINKNHFAFLMEIGLGLGLGIGLTSGIKREKVLIYVALLLPIWTGLVLSNSRGGILAMLAQVVVASILLTNGRTSTAFGISARKLSQSKLLRAALLCMLVLLMLIGSIWMGGDRLVSSFSGASTELNPGADGYRGGATRNEIWRASWKMFAAHPIVGVGLGGYWVAITEFHDASGEMTPQEAHNDYLELLSSGGLLGLAIGTWFAVSLFRRAKENLGSQNRFQRSVCFAAIIGIAGVAVHSLVDFGLHLLINALVFVILVMLATKRIEVEQH